MDEFRPLATTLPSLVNKLRWTIVIDDLNLDEKPLGKWQYLQHWKSIIPQKTLQRMTNNVGLMFSVGDTILCFKINIEQDD